MNEDLQQLLQNLKLKTIAARFDEMWSVDARLYGWKQIKISDRRQSGQDSSD